MGRAAARRRQMCERDQGCGGSWLPKTLSAKGVEAQPPKLGGLIYVNIPRVPGSGRLKGTRGGRQSRRAETVSGKRQNAHWGWGTGIESARGSSQSNNVRQDNSARVCPSESALGRGRSRGKRKERRRTLMGRDGRKGKGSPLFLASFPPRWGGRWGEAAAEAAERHLRHRDMQTCKPPAQRGFGRLERDAIAGADALFAGRRSLRLGLHLLTPSYFVSATLHATAVELCSDSPCDSLVFWGGCKIFR